jgi:type II secretory pathway pseudopilin PulG
MRSFTSLYKALSQNRDRLNIPRSSLSPLICSSPKKSLSGFTLVEIMVVVGIIMILALLVAPNILRARIDSNEATAIAHLRSLYNVLQLYYMNNDNTYPQGLSSLIPPASDPAYIDPELANGYKAGYLYDYTYVDEDNFYINADPKSPGKTGNRYFYLDATGVIRQNSEGRASGDDEPVQ